MSRGGVRTSRLLDPEEGAKAEGGMDPFGGVGDAKRHSDELLPAGDLKIWSNGGFEFHARGSDSHGVVQTVECVHLHDTPWI